jgi:hypothetical protein
VEVDRDGRTLKYRYNAIMFHEPVTLTGFILNGTSETLTGTTSMAADHPLNPYRHRYHPEHTTGYPITRAITLEFTPDDQDPDYVASGLAETAGDNELSGPVHRSHQRRVATADHRHRLLQATSTQRYDRPAVVMPERRIFMLKTLDGRTAVSIKLPRSTPATVQLTTSSATRSVLLVRRLLWARHMLATAPRMVTELRTFLKNKLAGTTVVVIRCRDYQFWTVYQMRMMSLVRRLRLN